MANFATKTDPLSLFVQNIETAHWYGSGQASSEMVGSRNRWHFSNTFYNIFGQTSHLDHLCTFLEFFSGISHMPTFSHSSWWSTALRTAKTTRGTRPARSLKLGCSTSIGIFFPTRMWYALVVSVDIFFSSCNMSENIKYMWIGGRRHCERQGQHGGEDQRGRWH